MRDFKAGGDINVGGDVHIHDESQQTKLLISCTNDELFEDRRQRKKLLGGERKRKVKRLALAWVIAGLFLSVVACYFYFNGQKEFAGLVVGLGGVAVALASVKVFEKPNEFEMRQMAALREIRYILRERGIE